LISFTPSLTLPLQREGLGGGFLLFEGDEPVIKDYLGLYSGESSPCVISLANISQ